MWTELEHWTMTRNRSVHRIWLRHHYHTGWQKHAWQVEHATGSSHTTRAHDSELEAQAHIAAIKQEWAGDWQPAVHVPLARFGPGQKPV